MDLQNNIFGISVDFANGDVERFKSYCANHLSLQEVIMTLSEEEIIKAILIEKSEKERLHILQRLYSRYGKLRLQREKKELIV